MSRIRYIFLFSILFVSISCSSQKELNYVSSTIILKKSTGGFMGICLAPMKLDINKEIYTGFPEEVEESIIKTFTFGPQTSIAAFSGNISSTKERVVILDSNRNLDFSDEQLHTFKYDSITQEFRTEGMFVDYYDSNKMNKSFVIHIDIGKYFDQYSNKLEEKLEISVASEEYLTGEIEIDAHKYNLFVIDNYPGPRLFAPVYVYFSKRGEKLITNYSKRDYNLIGEELCLNGYAIRLDSISTFGDSLYYSESGKCNSETDGFRLGDIASAFKTKSIDEEIFHSDDFKGKYTLIDFWGTWCRPCIEDMPNLRSFYELNPNVQIINVAVDVNLEKVINKINELNLDFSTHIFENRRNKGSTHLNQIFSVNSYPTLILIDPKGKIIYRGSEPDKYDIIHSLIENK